MLSEYEQHGRISGAPPEEAMELARRGYVADVVAGKDPLLMALHAGDLPGAEPCASGTT